MMIGIVDSPVVRRDLDIDLLRALVAVAERGGVTRAAGALGLSQSAVSMRLARREELAGVTLIDRSARRARPTREGELLLGYARRMIRLNDEATGALARGRLAGRVRLGVMEDYAVHRLPAILARAAATHPDITIEVETGLTSLLLERLGRDFELVVAMHPAGAGYGDRLTREAAVWAGAPGGTAHRADPLPLALAPVGCLFRQWALDALDAARRPWRLSFVSQSHVAVAAAVAAGLAVSVFKTSTLPRGLAPLGRTHDLPRLPEADIALHRATGLPPAAARIADLLSDAFAQPVPSRRASGRR